MEFETIGARGAKTKVFSKTQKKLYLAHFLGIMVLQII